MTIHGWRYAAILWGVSFVACTARSSSTSFLDRLDREVPFLLERHREPGIAVAFVDRCTAVVRAYGLANRQSATPVRSDTVFNLGSVSKTFTAWAVMTLVEAGKVRLDEPVDTYLKSWHLPESAFDRRAVTVRRLLNHTAGLSVQSVSATDHGAPIPPLVVDLNGQGAAEAAVQIVQAPGHGFQYSGGGYAVLQLLVEDLTGQSLNEYAQQVLFAPLMMTSTAFGWNPATVQRAAMPYQSDGSPYRLRDFSASGAAGLVSTAQDMSAFLLAHCPNAHTKVLKLETLAQMRAEGVPASGLGWWSRSSQVSFAEELRYRLRRLPVPGPRYALGYTVFSGRGPEFDFAGHSGSNIGWKAELITMPAQGLGVVIMTNASDGLVRSDVRDMFRDEIRSRMSR